MAMFRALFGGLRRVRSTSKYLRSTITFIETYPKVSVGIGVLLSSPLIDRYLRRRAKSRLQSPILARLEAGSRPARLPHLGDQTIERPDITATLRSLAVHFEWC
jgi:hypothetical protein